MSAPPTHSVENEQAVLGLCMHSTRYLAEVRDLLTIDDFWRPAHQEIYAVLLDLGDAGRTADPVRVMNALTERGKINHVGGATYLHTLYATSATGANVGYYAEKLREASRVRQLERIIARLSQVHDELGGDMDRLLTEVAREAIALEVLADESGLGRAIEGLHTVDDFLAIVDRPEDFIVPKFLEAQDVWMLLAGEGVGKSWISRQLTECIAAGVHPFRPSQAIEPRRTLLVDLENAGPQVRRQTRPMLAHILRLAHADWDPDRAWIWHYPGGLNLRNRADAALFERVIAETRPDFIAFGSLYKAFTRGRDDWDTATEEVRVVFDRIRARYRCAFWLEHHMPKGDGKSGRPELPFGSSVWQRWAGFGRVIDQVGPNMYELKASFRSDRDLRDFPLALTRGGDLPWSAVWDETEVDYGRFRDGDR